jgi:hypothetical protein
MDQAESKSIQDQAESKSRLWSYLKHAYSRISKDDVGKFLPTYIKGAAGIILFIGFFWNPFGVLGIEWVYATVGLAVLGLIVLTYILWMRLAGQAKGVFRPVPRRLALGGACCGVLALALWIGIDKWRDPEINEGPIAIFPFGTYGVDTTLAREIALQLEDEVAGEGGLRVVPKALDKWNLQTAEGSAPNLALKLQIARDVGASFALTGNVQGTKMGRGVDITAQLYDATEDADPRSIEPRDTAAVSGSSGRDSIEALVHRLSTRILLKSGFVQDSEQVDLGPVTTDSASAAKPCAPASHLT